MEKGNFNIQLEDKLENKLEDMMEARVFWGCFKKRWNPKVAPYIITKEELLNSKIDSHVINPAKTARFLLEACNLLYNAASKGKSILFIGIGKDIIQYSVDSDSNQVIRQNTTEPLNKPKKVLLDTGKLVRLAAKKALCNFMNEKWFRGTLTNWSVTQFKLTKLKNLEISEKKGEFQSLSKRDAAIQKKKLLYLQKYFGGIKHMKDVPSIVIIVDPKKEKLALQECRALGITTIILMDTNADPDLGDIPIPANIQSYYSMESILQSMVNTIFGEKKQEDLSNFHQKKKRKSFVDSSSESSNLQLRKPKPNMKIEKSKQKNAKKKKRKTFKNYKKKNEN